MTAIWDKIFRGYYYCDHLSNLLTLIQYGGIVGGNDNNYRSLKLRIEASSKFGWKSLSLYISLALKIKAGRQHHYKRQREKWKEMKRKGKNERSTNKQVGIHLFSSNR